MIALLLVAAQVVVEADGARAAAPIALEAESARVEAAGISVVSSRSGSQIAIDVTVEHDARLKKIAIEITLPGAAHVIGRDRRFSSAPSLVLERFDPKWIAFGDHTLVIDDGVDAVEVRRRGHETVVTVELESALARPFLHRAQCVKDWHRAAARVPAGARSFVKGETLHARLQLIEGSPEPLLKSPYPDGRRAAFAITDHADQSSAHTLAPLAEALVAHSIAVTKALFARSGGRGARPQLDDPQVVAVAEKLRAAGSELAPHTATPRSDAREVTAAAVEKFHALGARVWINHQPETNCEAFGAHGWQHGKWSIADLLAKGGFEYVWSIVDAPAGPLNLFDASHPDRRAPTLWPLGRLEKGAPAGLWMFRSMWAFVEARQFFTLYSTAALDRLERERGLHIAHTYLETLHGRRTRFGQRNLMVEGNPVTLDPALSHLLDELAARQQRGTLWIPTLSQLGDCLRQAAEVQLTVEKPGQFIAHAPAPVAGMTFVIPRDDVEVLVAGTAPGLTREDGETRFSVDLPAGDTSIEVRPSATAKR